MAAKKNPLLARVETALENVDTTLETLQELYTDLTGLLQALKRAEKKQSADKAESEDSYDDE